MADDGATRAQESNDCVLMLDVPHDVRMAICECLGVIADRAKTVSEACAYMTKARPLVVVVGSVVTAEDAATLQEHAVATSAQLVLAEDLQDPTKLETVMIAAWSAAKKRRWLSKT